MMVHVTHGPYIDQRLTMSSADAAIAISEGWAFDPYKQPPDPPVVVTEAELYTLLQNAHHAAIVLRDGQPLQTRSKK